MRVAAFFVLQLIIGIPVFAVAVLIHLRWFERDIAQRRVTLAQASSGLAITYCSFCVGGAAANAILVAVGW
jgi:hypothetical protein